VDDDGDAGTLTCRSRYYSVDSLYMCNL